LVGSRPSPEDLLRRIQTEELRAGRGRLKVFLGYASRVGKSYRMLDEGRRRRMRGEDVVVAATQFQSAPEIEALLASSECIPMLQVRHDGRDYQVLDLPAIFRRHPQVCVIDELAYNNPPGSRNAARWQDVLEILANGISVTTAVNLQHIAEYQERVERITGKHREQTVPESFLRTADDIEVVDAALDSLRERGVAPDELRKISELRDFALLLAADVVDQQLRAYLDAHDIHPVWGAHECILVCLTPRSEARSMLESGRRNADRFHGRLLAVYVRQPHLAAKDHAVVDAHLKLAESMGAEVCRLEGTDFVRVLLDFARAQGVTQLFVGHTGEPRGWLARFRRGPLERLIDAAADMDVRIFPHGGDHDPG
jgi:two-component system sensor histidine kinase KdpD